MSGLPRSLVFSHACQFLRASPCAILPAPHSRQVCTQTDNTGKTLCKNPSSSAFRVLPFSLLVSQPANPAPMAGRPCRRTRSALPVALWPARRSPRSLTKTSPRVPSSALPVARFATTPASASAANNHEQQARRGRDASPATPLEKKQCRRNSLSFSDVAFWRLPAAPRASTRPMPTVPSSALASGRPLLMSAAITPSRARRSALPQARFATTFVSANKLTAAPRRDPSLQFDSRPGLAPGRLFYVRP